MRIDMQVLIVIVLLFSASLVAAQEKQAKSELTFLSHRSGHNLLYRSDPNGDNPVPIFGGPIADVPSFDDSYSMYREPHWTRQSPNGKYFSSWVYERGMPSSGYRGASRPMLWAGGTNGSWARIVNPDCHEEFAWSPNSKQIAFSILSTDHYRGSLQNRPETTQICISGIDGSNFDCVLEQHGKWFVMDWSPDGKKLLLLRRDLGEFLKDVDTINHELFEFRLSDALEARSQNAGFDLRNEWAAESAQGFLSVIDLNLGDLQPSEARYSPTNNEIAVIVFDRHNMFAPNLLEEGDRQMQRMMRTLGKIYVYDVETQKSRLIADYDDGIRGPICWPPDGNEIYFSRYLPKDDDREKFAESKQHGLSIWAIGRAGEDSRFITTGWSPDLPRIGK